MGDRDHDLSRVLTIVEAKFKSIEMGKDRWYIAAAACIAASSDPEVADQLYTYLIRKPEYSTPQARQALIRRIREALVKSVSIVGVCKPMESIMAISKKERDEDRDYTCSREKWQCDQGNHERGLDWFHKLYAQNATDTVGLFDSHKDFAWLSIEITYGLYLSDRQTIDDLDTQLVVLPAIMMQNLRTETHWHIRGTRRLGVAKKHVEVICECVKLLADFFGMQLNKVPSVEDVEHDV